MGVLASEAEEVGAGEGPYHERKEGTNCVRTESAGLRGEMRTRRTSYAHVTATKYNIPAEAAFSEATTYPGRPRYSPSR